MFEEKGIVKDVSRTNPIQRNLTPQSKKVLDEREEECFISKSTEMRLSKQIDGKTRFSK